MTSLNSPIIIKSLIRLHPNPVTDFFQISGIDSTAMLIISDLNCFTLLKKQIVADECIAVDTLKKGVYVAKIITSTETIERKLVKK